MKSGLLDDIWMNVELRSLVKQSKARRFLQKKKKLQNNLSIIDNKSPIFCCLSPPSPRIEHARYFDAISIFYAIVKILTTFSTFLLFFLQSTFNCQCRVCYLRYPIYQIFSPLVMPLVTCLYFLKDGMIWMFSSMLKAHIGC